MCEWELFIKPNKPTEIAFDILNFKWLFFQKINLKEDGVGYAAIGDINGLRLVVTSSDSIEYQVI